MARFPSASVLIPALFGLSACVTVPAARETRVIVQPPPQQYTTVAAAPGPPPPPHSELVPTTPALEAPVVWQPGHWHFRGKSGNPCSSQPGQYVPPPPGQTTWIPGRWMQQPTGSWSWVDGHWA